MVDVTYFIVDFVLLTLIFVLSSIPLYLAVKVLGGKTGFLKVLFVSFISGLLISALKQFIFGGIIAFLVLVVIYRELFRLKWWKAFIVWFVQLVFVVLFYLFLSILGLVSLEITGFLINSL